MRSSDSDMLKRYFTRTVEHIHRVQNNMVYLLTNHMETLGLNRNAARQCMHNVMAHDLSKFSALQFEAYIEITEFYYQRKKRGNTDYEYPTGIKKQVSSAITDHYHQENHHPARMKHDPHFNFSTFEAIETVCDLQALSQEFNEPSCRSFFEKVWCVKHQDDFLTPEHFTNTTDYMRKVISCFEE